MAKVTGPLLSLGARGSIAKTQVYAAWRGVPYVRQHVVPGNPRTTEQTLTRSVFSWLMGVWKQLDPSAQAPWTAFASGKPLTNRNAFASTNIPLLRVGSDTAAFVASPGAKGGLAAGAATATGGSGTIATTLAAPALPTGWTITQASAVAIKSADPHSSLVYTSAFAFDASSPYAPAFSGLASGLWDVSLWFQYLTDKGVIAYGPSQTVTATVT